MQRVVDGANRIIEALEGKGFRDAKCPKIPEPTTDSEAVAA
jgi:hypothetical protein